VSHIPDTGKMVGDTPRTDAAWKPDGGDYFIVDVDLARQLERELNASTSEIERLTNKVAQLYEGAEEQKQRIKRLEEALRQIANQDYRGNRSTESQIAFEALKEVK
jgi:hypothetical protein